MVLLVFGLQVVLRSSAILDLAYKLGVFLIYTQFIQNLVQIKCISDLLEFSPALSLILA